MFFFVQQGSMRTRGFTLVELAIVMVIIGLIVATVVTGQTFVQQAKIRSLTSEMNRYVIAYNTFKLRYNALPGDISVAQNFWAGAANGNNDGAINSQTTECLYAWEHVAEAGLISGTFTGADNGTPDVLLNSNTPESSVFTDVGFMYSYIGKTNNCLGTATSAMYGVDTNFNALGVGSVNPTVVTDTNACPRHGFLTIPEAKGIDSKMDDGQPTTGNLFVANAHNVAVNGSRCLDATIITAGAAYDMDETGAQCRLVLKLQ